ATSDWEQIKTLALENTKIMVELPRYSLKAVLKGAKVKRRCGVNGTSLNQLHSLKQNYEAMVIAANEQDAKALKSAIKKCRPQLQKLPS
ncbi:hypothetical protein AT251_24515, partial [Enterovibrio nigricans]